MKKARKFSNSGKAVRFLQGASIAILVFLAGVVAVLAWAWMAMKRFLSRKWRE